MSWLLGIYGTKAKVCPETEGLEDDDDDDDDDEFSYTCQTAHPPPQCKSYDNSSDTQVEDLGELTQFSLSLRDSFMVKDEGGVKNEIYAKRLAKHALELEEEAQEFQEPFYKDMKMPGSLSKDKDHSQAYHIPVHQGSHVLPPASMAPCGSSDYFQRNTRKHLGMDAFAPQVHASDPYLGSPEHTKGQECHMLHKEATGEFPPLQLTYDRLREENTMLRRLVSSLQSILKHQACKVRRLKWQLKATLAKEERETQELQSCVQQTAWSLQLMTQRALEAESNVEKLEQMIFILQGELESCKAENENLRAGQTTDLETVRHNIDFALQNLHKIITGANWSIRQLTSGTESLQFITEVLKSTGKISEVEAEKEL